MALADVLARYPDCAAMGSVLGSAIDGLELSDQSNEDGTVQCNWMSTTGDYVNTVLVTVTTNNGAVDVPKKDDIAAIGSEYIAGAAVEARGGIAYGTKSTGDCASTARSSTCREWASRSARVRSTKTRVSSAHRPSPRRSSCSASRG
jgi:hypothetical protein